jgi:hypothetical protein
MPFRTGRTWLTDDQLILLDAMFARGTFFRLLCREGYFEQWNLGYAHRLDEAELRLNLRWLCEHGVLGSEVSGNQTVFHLTPAGGDLWSQERCPVWDRYCTECYRTTSRGKTMMTVYAVSSRVRDEFLALWPPAPARRRTSTIVDRGLIGWRPFSQVFVGVATYQEQRECTPAEYAEWARRYHQHQVVLENQRTWWRCVPELQRFVRRPADPGAPADGPIRSS